MGAASAVDTVPVIAILNLCLGFCIARSKIATASTRQKLVLEVSKYVKEKQSKATNARKAPLCRLQQLITTSRVTTGSLGYSKSNPNLPKQVSSGAKIYSVSQCVGHW